MENIFYSLKEDIITNYDKSYIVVLLLLLAILSYGGYMICALVGCFI